MALQSSGAISLNQIHVEAGGTSGTQASLNDSDIRGLISKASGASMSFSEWYGASAGQTVTVTQGTSGSVRGYQGGYGTSATYGSISPSNFTVNGATLGAIYYSEATIKGQTTRFFFVYLAGHRAKSFFTSVAESSLGTLTTASATSHVQSSSGSPNHPWTYWTWSPSSTPANWDGSGNLTVDFA